MINYSGECDCGDYCEYCHPELCYPEALVFAAKAKKERTVKKMSPELRDKLLTWLQERKDILKFSLKESKGDKDLLNVMRGQLDAFSNVVAFILTEGKLK